MNIAIFLFRTSLLRPYFSFLLLPCFLLLNLFLLSKSPAYCHPTSRAARAYPLPGPNGFVPSDPDDLSSHEKKRLYVESLERYIQYLHQLFAFLNIAPAPLQRVSNYRALTSRSMRTILLVLRRSAEAIHALTVEEASKSIHLREALLQAQAINSDRDQIFEIRETTVSPSSDSAGTSSTCVTAADPDATDISKYFADPSF
ncbi:hypothetical protein B0H15DRAFT_214797 [Mycena belliarum]|uniref:Uncharacterized protein n=1 Tax=Mycena belliarum TaxID=1033014 RepID=A0AAD6UIJ8_9AGAR|nr:hypothetical protein B0H15DRAFT_214797 [Mycena belliae]